jgi:large subunit ribosomal protein L24
MKLRKGDIVKVTTGKDSGKEAKIERVFRQNNTAVVTGVNVYKRHLRPKAQRQQGGIVDMTKPINVAKIALICPKCKVQTRVGYKLINDKKVRICRKCDQEID